MRPLLFALVLLTPSPALAQPAADSADVGSIDALVAALYDVISGPADEDRDWDRFRALFHPEGRLVPMQPTGGGAWAPTVLSPDDFARMNAELMRTHPTFQGKGFYEAEVARRAERYGTIATVWSTYVGRLERGGEPFVRGVNAIDLTYDGARWWVLQILWQQETPEIPLPDEYLVSED